MVTYINIRKRKYAEAQEATHADAVADKIGIGDTVQVIRTNKIRIKL